MLIGLSGYARSGKDTVGKYLEEQYEFKRIAFADALKQFAYILDPIVEGTLAGHLIRLQKLVELNGWEEAKKSNDVRRLLQVLGTECGRDIIGPNVWVDIVARKIEEQPGDWVITDCRFTNELNFVKNQTNGISWWVNRPGIGPLNSHISENQIIPENTDIILDNTGTIEKLYSNVAKLMGDI